MSLALVRPPLMAIALLCATSSLQAHGPWVVLKDCREVADQANDADSFHVRAGGKEYIFRLYFVDAPETDASFPERVNEQAKYFALTVPQTLQLGNLAKHFTEERLARPFIVRTCMQDALGRSRKERFYAFIETTQGDLNELLVANGLARLHGSQAKPDGLSSPEIEWQKLERLEREARTQKVGGWGAPAGRMTARLPKQPDKTGPDSFDAFFHPERLAATPTPEPQITTTPSATAPGTASNISTDRAPNGAPKLDINTATAEELTNLPGVGEVIAQRIIAKRPYATADFLSKVKGIGPKKYVQLRPYFLDAPLR